MHKKFIVGDSGTDNALEGALDFIRERLAALKLSKRDANRAGLMCEESLSSLLKAADFSSMPYFSVKVRKTLAILGLAVVSGVALKEFFPESVYMAVNDDIFVPIRTVFMNGLKMCAVPVVLFSIITCISEIGSMSGLEKAGGRLIRYFLLFQAVSTAIAFGLMSIFRPGAGVHMAASSVEIAGGGVLCR